MKRLFVALLALGCLAAPAALPNAGVWKDNHGALINAHGGALMKDGATWWWYGEHKTSGSEGNKAWVGVHAYSSMNLLDWTDRGIVFKVATPDEVKANPALKNVQAGCILERPKVAKAQDGSRYVMYFHLEPKGAGYNGALTGIAEAKTPEGPFSLVWTGRPNAGAQPVNAAEDPTDAFCTAAPWQRPVQLWRSHLKGGQMSRDMTLFTDPASGIVYHVFASEDNSCLHIAELRPDGLGYTGKWARLTPGDWTEAPALVKRGEWYFLLGSGCTGWRANAARYYRAKSVWGPWERMDNPCHGLRVTNSKIGASVGSELTWGGQSTGIFEVNGVAFAMFDIWRASNAIDGRYVWLPIQFNDRGEMRIDYRETFKPELAAPWEDEIVTEINRLPARTTLRPLDASHVIDLSGTWDFTFVNPPSPGREDAPEERLVGKIEVPSCWQLAARNLEGSKMKVDPPQYVNIKYPFANHPPYVTDEPKDHSWTSLRYRIPRGIYTKKVTIPASWAGRRTILRLNGYSSAVYVKVNGETIGYGEDGRLANEWDITRVVRGRLGDPPLPGPVGGDHRAPRIELTAKDDGSMVGGDHRAPRIELTLELTVLKHSDGSYLEDQDFWRLSGLFRSVELVSEPKDGLYDFNVITRVSAGGVGVISLKARVAAECDPYQETTNNLSLVGDALRRVPSHDVSWKLFDHNGDELLRGHGAEELTLPHVRLWSPEDPYLYTIRVSSAGETYERKVGFRTVAIEDGVLKLNGTRLVVHGVDRHEMSPIGGYAMTRAEMERDIALLKRFNINAVRTSHYPNDPYWYELCDKAGILLVAEANIECHGSGHPLKRTALSHVPSWGKAMLERNLNQVGVLRDHPAIIGWSVANESGTGMNLTNAYTAVKAADPTRFVQYEGIFNPYRDFNFGVYGSDIICPMYAKPADIEKAMTTSDFVRPYILCEYAHAMGNSTGNFAEYMALIDKYPRFQGGFIWDFADQALYVDGTLKYGGDFGDVPGEKNGHCNGLFDAFRNPHPGAYEVAYFYGGRQPIAYQPRAAAECGPYHPTTVSNNLSLVGDALRRVPSPNATLGSGRVPSPEIRRVPSPDLTPCLSFWRAPTDNDNGNKLAKRSAVWREATETGVLPNGVTTNLVVTPVPNGYRYDFTLTVPASTPEIPRVGLSFALPGDLATKVTWHGAGPWENYSDRASSASIGDYAMNVAELNDSRYVRPEECGHRTKTTRLQVGDYVFTAESVSRSQPQPSTSTSSFEWNIHPWTTAQLEKANHVEELPPPDGTLHVFIDAAMRGVGGDDSWGAPVHRKYRLEGPRTYHLIFDILSYQNEVRNLP